MNDNSLVIDLVEDYREQRRQGRTVAPEDICAAHPELIAEVKRAIRKVEQMERQLDPEEETRLSSDPPAGPGSEAAGRWPTIPGYEILDWLGGGGMGDVYKARERDTGLLVALKLPRQLNAEALDRFKKEFRILQRIAHPNLVTLFDAAFDGPQPYFTMEFVEGRCFLPHPGARFPTGSEPTSDQGSYLEAGTAVAPGLLHSSPLAGRGAPHWDDLRRLLQQLADGILALHARRIWHRDIKPSNVQVSPHGRVVLLDFGLAMEGQLDRQSATRPELAGTLPYMAPELAQRRADGASDWFSFGVLLYEALTGCHPFEGPQKMPWNRQQYEPPPPCLLCPDIPDDLSQLCSELLRVVPAARPDGAEVRRRLGAQGMQGDLPPTRAEPVFIGREAALAALEGAFADLRSGRTVTVLVHGKSGVGKTALVQRFLSRLTRQPSAARILRGRCYERESVPYKALDDLVDDLASFWRRLERDDRAEAMRLLPTDVGPLLRIFPALGRVETVVAAPRPAAEAPDPHELRRRAFAALREVLARIGTRWPLVVHLDDLQWGDVDSARMLTNLLLPPDPPRLLLLAGFRSEDRATSPFLRHFLESPPAGLPVDRREVTLEELSLPEARVLAGRLLQEKGRAQDEAAETVARQSAGDPIFIVQLVQAVLSGEPDITLEKVIWNRACALPAEQRRLLEVVAVAGRPLRLSVALRAAGLGEQGKRHLLDLQAAYLLRGGPAGQEAVETFHDRIRAIIAGRLDPAARTDCHRRLALALEVWGKADPEVLAFHLQESGQAARAWPHYIRAADEAVETLAFDRAVRLYDLALQGHPGKREAARPLQLKLAEALVNAGRGVEAARTYLAAVDGAAAGEVADLQRKAAVQFLRSGHMDEGLALLDSVLRDVGLRLPRTHTQAFLSSLFHRAWIRLRGLGFRERPASTLSPEQLRRLDICWSVTQLTLSDPIRGVSFHQRHLLMALRAGEPHRVARGLATEICHAAMRGGRRAEGRVQHLVEQVTALAGRVNDPYLRAMTDLNAGGAALLLGHWKKAQHLSDRAEEVFRNQCTGVAWELATARHFSLFTLDFMGEWKECSRRVPGLLKDAQARGDLYTLSSLLIHHLTSCVAGDRPEEANEIVREATQLCVRHGYYLQRYHAVILEVILAIYRGEGLQAWQIINERWPLFRRSLLLHVQQIYLVMVQLRALAAIAATRDGQRLSNRPTESYLLKCAEQDIRRVEKADMAWSKPLATLLRANLAARRGNIQAAAALLAKAEKGLATVDMAVHAACARRRLGLVLGGDEGRSLVAAADAWMAGQEIRNPARLARAYTVGFPDQE